MTERLYRHPTDRAIAGVAGGLAAWLNLDPSLVRIAWVLLAIFSGGAFVLVYIVMMIVVPLAPPGWAPRPRDGWGTPPDGWGPSGPATWGPTAAPGAAPGGAPTHGWGDPAAPGWGDPRAPGTGADPAPSWGAGPNLGPTPGWGTNTAPTQTPWTAPKPGSAGIVAGVILVVLGLWFLVDQYVRVDWNLLWPVVIMVIGGALIAGAWMRRRD